MTYAHTRNTSVMHASANIESVRPRSNTERLAEFRAKRAKNRRVTVPQPLSPLPAGAQPAPSLAARAGRQSYTTGDAA